MKNPFVQIIAYPFAIVYGFITGIRNWLFDIGILPSQNFAIPTISVGNLAVGGTGKTPHAEFLLSFLKAEWKVALLSRGYKRKTKGFYLAISTSDSNALGDESYQIHKKFSDLTVAVDEKRVRGVKKLQEIDPSLQVVVLDDAMQHRQIHPGLSILLTDFSALYTHDTMLPAGNLREWRSGSRRASIIVVTKCPLDLKPIDMRLIETEIHPETNQLLFFSSFVYDEIVPVFPSNVPIAIDTTHIKSKKAQVLLVAGIVSPEAIVEQLKLYTPNVQTRFYGDHHNFTQKDFASISKSFDALVGAEKYLIVTEKDAARIVSNPLFPEELKAFTYSLPIHVEILFNQKELFVQKVQSYVTENSRNR